MNKILEQAKIVLSVTDYQEFEDAFNIDEPIRCFSILRDNKEEALDALKQSAINGDCDPIVASHYKDSHNLSMMFKNYCNND